MCSYVVHNITQKLLLSMAIKVSRNVIAPVTCIPLAEMYTLSVSRI